jgi:hypothetical protein
LSALLPLLMVAELIGVQIQKKNFKQQLILHSPALYKFQETLFISNDNYSNQHVGDEISLNGNMYDILSIEKKTNGYYFKVFNDILDQKFESLLSQHSNENHPSKKSNKKSIQNIQLYVESFLDFQYPVLKSITPFTLFNSRLTEGFRSTLFLPPEFC